MAELISKYQALASVWLTRPISSLVIASFLEPISVIFTPMSAPVKLRRSDPNIHLRELRWWMSFHQTSEPGPWRSRLFIPSVRTSLPLICCLLLLPILSFSSCLLLLLLLSLSLSIPPCLLFCPWLCISPVPCRHVALATGVKGRMKERAASPPNTTPSRVSISLSRHLSVRLRWITPLRLLSHLSSFCHLTLRRKALQAGSAFLINWRSGAPRRAPRPRTANKSEMEIWAMTFNMFPGPIPTSRGANAYLWCAPCAWVCMLSVRHSEASQGHKLLSTFVLLTLHHVTRCLWMLTALQMQSLCFALGDASLAPTTAVSFTRVRFLQTAALCSFR